MIESAFFYRLLKERGTDFFTGVPDSLLKSFCAFLRDKVPAENHIIAANEGGAAALAAGFHLATGKTALVYMQNSGIGNAVNPLLSLADPLVYRIPLLLLIGWRGEPGVKDEPQHAKQGLVSGALLDAMGIPWEIMAAEEGELERQLDDCYRYLTREKAPRALLVKKDSFAPYEAAEAGIEERGGMSREEAIEEILRRSSPEELYFSTTGMASRELWEIRERTGAGHGRDFLTVGSMGHASQIALAAALRRPERSVTCLDGDGALIMHMGALAITGSLKPANFRHIVLNNGAHDSVGGQPTAAPFIDIPALAAAAGYAQAWRAETREELREALEQAGKRRGPALIEARVRRGARKDLGRPKSSPEENKSALMKEMEK